MSRFVSRRALAEHAREGNEKGVMLSLWAGADPHAPAMIFPWPALGDTEDEEELLDGSAVYRACSAGHDRILEKLGLDPALDDYEELYGVARTGPVVAILARRALPKKMGPIVTWQVYWLEDPGSASGILGEDPRRPATTPPAPP